MRHDANSGFAEVSVRTLRGNPPTGFVFGRKRIDTGDQVKTQD